MLCALLLISLAAGLAGAQPKLGDLVLNEKKPLGHVVSLDRSTGLLATIVPGPISTNRAILGLTMARNNTDMYLLEEGGPGFYLWSIAPNGTVTTVMPASASGEGAPTPAATCCRMETWWSARPCTRPGTTSGSSTR